jgi:hypothetical protein
VVVKLIHILARQQERQYYKRAEYEVNFFHSRPALRQTLRQPRAIWTFGA